MSLSCKLQQKLPECMLARYQRWLFESGREESVTASKTFGISRIGISNHCFRDNIQPERQYRKYQCHSSNTGTNKELPVVGVAAKKLHNRLLHTNYKRKSSEEPIARRQSLDRMVNSNNNNSKPKGSSDSGSQSTSRNNSVMEGKLERHRPDRRESGCGTSCIGTFGSGWY